MSASEEKLFVGGIEADRYDQTLRLAYADWLEEHGRDDEAAWQRAWTPRWQQAEDYFGRLAEESGAPLGEIVAAAGQYLKEGRTQLVDDGGGAVGMNLCNLMGFEYPLEEFWAHWTAYTKSDELCDLAKPGDPFHCCGDHNAIERIRQ